jgi:hypothetical protein
MLMVLCIWAADFTERRWECPWCTALVVERWVRVSEPVEFIVMNITVEVQP